MIQPLRVWHRRIFVALVFLLPLIFLAGLHARHGSSSQGLSTQ
jgi:hypothetical protein